MGDKDMSIVMHNVSGPFTIGDKTFPHGVREVVIADDGTITVNGKPIDQCNVNEIEQSGLHISVTGSIESVILSDVPAIFHGRVGEVHASDGCVSCENISGNVTTQGGSVSVSGDVKGNINTNGGSYIESHYYNK